MRRYINHKSAYIIMKKLVSEIVDSVISYTIPTKKQHKKGKLGKDVTWIKLYGKKKCYVCNEHFNEGDEYTAEASVRKRSQWVVPYRHCDCDPLNPPKPPKKTRNKK